MSAVGSFSPNGLPPALSSEELMLPASETGASNAGESHGTSPSRGLQGAGTSVLPASRPSLLSVGASCQQLADLWKLPGGPRVAKRRFHESHDKRCFWPVERLRLSGGNQQGTEWTGGIGQGNDEG